jgi:general secretion pathway protein J
MTTIAPPPSAVVGAIGHRPRQRGFTLLEIIVVVLVFSVMAAMAYGGLNSVLRTRNGIEQSMNRTAEFQRTFMRLRTDLQNLRDRPARDRYGDPEPALSYSEDGVLRLIRGGWRSPLDSGRSSMERVSFELVDGALRRASHPVLDLPQQAEPVDLPLLTAIDEVRWRFLDGARQWQDQWPPRALQTGDRASLAAVPPPIAIELTLVAPDWGELRLLFRTPVSQLAGSGGAGGESGLLTTQGLLPGRLAGAAQAPAAASPDSADPDADADPANDPSTPAPGSETRPDDGGLAGEELT